MLPVAESIREVAGLAPDALPDEVLGSPEPLVLRGLVGQWPMVRAGRESAATIWPQPFRPILPILPFT